MMMFIGPRHSSGAHNSRAPLQWHAQMKVFFQGGGVAGFVDSWPETLVTSASNRSTPEWTLADSCQSGTRNGTPEGQAQPPACGRTWPVMKPAPAEHRKQIAAPSSAL